MKIKVLLIILILLAGCSSKNTFKETFINLNQDKIISIEELSQLNADDLRILRNSIFAKHGYKFKSKELELYFYGPGSMPFGIKFSESEKFTESLLSSNDLKNIDTILNAEKNQINPETEALQSQNENVQSVTESEYTPAQIVNILNKQIFEYFDDLKIYDTDLKRKQFLESDKSEKYLTELDELGKRLKSKEIKLDISNSITISNYDLKRKGVYLLLPYFGGFWTYGDASGNKNVKEVSIIDGFYSDIPTESYYIERYKNSSDHFVRYRFFISCSEAIGAKIENEKSDVFYSFKISDEGHMFIDYLNNSGSSIGQFAAVKVHAAKIDIYSHGEQIIEYNGDDI